MTVRKDKGDLNILHLGPQISLTRNNHVGWTDGNVTGLWWFESWAAPATMTTLTS
jgi:hypothetical protein